MNTNKQLVQDYMQSVWVEQKIDQVGNFIADDLIQHNPNLLDGRKALEDFLPVLFNDLMPNLKWQVARVIAEDDLVVVHSLATTPAMPNGMAVVEIFRVESGKIVEHWDAIQSMDGFMRFYALLTGGTIRNANGVF